MQFNTKIFILSIFLYQNISANEQIMGPINLETGYKLVPYEEAHKTAFKEIVHDKDVYPFVGMGSPWTDETIDARHLTYLESNNNNGDYNPDTFIKCWMLISPTEDIIGRGGFLPEKSFSPHATQIFMTIKGDYQCKSQPHLKLGTQFFAALIQWFNEKIGSEKLLRWLAKDTNEISQHLAVKNGFTPLMEGNHHRRIILPEMVYLVYERKN